MMRRDYASIPSPAHRGARSQPIVIFAKKLSNLVVQTILFTTKRDSVARPHHHARKEHSMPSRTGAIRLRWFPAPQVSPIIAHGIYARWPLPAARAARTVRRTTGVRRPLTRASPSTHVHTRGPLFGPVNTAAPAVKYLNAVSRAHGEGNLASYGANRAHHSTVTAASPSPAGYATGLRPVPRDP